MAMMEKPEVIKAKVAEHAPEPIVAVGMVQPAGTWGAAGLLQASPLAGMLRQRSANQKAGSLNTRGAVFKTNRQTFIALSADRLYAFESKVGWGGVKIREPLGIWERKDLEVHTLPGKVSTRIVIDDRATGEHYELEATTALSRGFNDHLLREIVGATA